MRSEDDRSKSRRPVIDLTQSAVDPEKEQGSVLEQNGLRADYRLFAQIAESHTPFRWHFRAHSTLDKELL